MKELREYVLWSRLKSHQRRIDQARAALETAAASGPIVISTSWGKDSVALCDLALETLGQVPLFHLASTYEISGAEHVVEHFRSRAVVHEARSKMSLCETIEWLQQHGLGFERDAERSAGVKRKTDAALQWTRDHGFAAQALGMRAEESRSRATCFRVRGLVYRAHGLTVANPLGWWTSKDVWAYIAARGLPYHRLYDCETHGQTRETLRNGGWLTMPGWGADHRAGWLRQHFPNEYERLVQHFPQIRSLT